MVGAGASGLVAAHELRCAGHQVTVFERSAEIGGVWVYDEAPGRTMYASLRTNLPRDLMAFRSYPFDSRGGGADDQPRFPTHEVVLAYLRRFADDRDLIGLIRFETEVVDIDETPTGWAVRTRRDGVEDGHEFAAIAVCNGHFTVPREIEIAGSAEFPGVVVHSRDYRHPGPFVGMRVATVGVGSSGLDLSLEIATVAEHVYWCGHTSADERTVPAVDRLSPIPMPDRLTSDGLLVVGDRRIPVDAVMLCTGFHYDLSFIAEGIVAGDDAPTSLYRHLLPVGHPTMALIGIPQRIIPFPLFEMQAKWFAAILSGEVTLPALVERRAWLEEWAAHCRSESREPYQCRNLGAEQFDYIDELAAECGAQPLPDWYRPLAQETTASRLGNLLEYRDLPLTTKGDSRVSL